MSENKPDWLQALEAQSWQAELIASGLAIYGSLSLGVYLDNIAEWAVLRFDDRILDILYFFVFYIYIAHAVLVISFITHLALRILWAGILGLSSAYPEGINTETKAYAPHFKEKLKQEFPDLSKYSLELDKLCSMIFSILCAMIILLVSISFWIIVYLFLSELLLKIVPENVVNYIGFIFIGLLLLFSILSSLLTQGKLKNSNFAKKYAYKLNQRFGKFFYFFGYKAFSYISQTIRTNVTSKLFFAGMMGILFISMLMAVPRFTNMVPYYKQDIFVNLNGHESYVETASYLDKLEGSIVLLPFIQTEIIKEPYIQLYIPKYKREAGTMTTLCGEFEWNDDLTDQKNRKLRNTFKSDCAAKYYKLSIDAIPLKNIQYQYRRYLYNNREGYLVYINADTLKAGIHILRIESAYRSEENTFIRSIPFYKE